MPLVLLTVKVLELAKICNLPAYLSSAVHLEPVFMYKGEVCTSKFAFIRAKGYVKVGAVNNCWEDQQAEA